MFYYHGSELYAVRKGEYKLHFTTKTEYMGQKPTKHESPVLYHLGEDPGEKFDLAKENPEVVEAMVKLADTHKGSFTPPESQLEARIARGAN